MLKDLSPVPHWIQDKMSSDGGLVELSFEDRQYNTNFKLRGGRVFTGKVFARVEEGENLYQ